MRLKCSISLFVARAECVVQVEHGPREKAPATLPACISAAHNGGSRLDNPKDYEEHDPQRESERGVGGGASTQAQLTPFMLKKKKTDEYALLAPARRPLQVYRCRRRYYWKAAAAPPPPPPLLSPPPSTPPPPPPPLIRSYINSPRSGGEPNPGVSSLPADDAIRWFILSPRPDGITATSLSR